MKIQSFEYYEQIWKSELIKLSKAESYSLYKNSTKLEKYLILTKNQKHRKAISRFRLSCHPLMIEKGRHQNPSLIRSERICPHCANLVEDECHFLTTCPLYKIERSRLYVVCTNTSKNFLTMTNTQKFIFILSNENSEVIRNLGSFIFKFMAKRKQYLDRPTGGSITFPFLS